MGTGWLLAISRSQPRVHDILDQRLICKLVMQELRAELLDIHRLRILYSARLQVGGINRQMLVLLYRLHIMVVPLSGACEQVAVLKLGLLMAYGVQV